MDKSVPVVVDLNKKVLDAVLNVNNELDMDDWHTCNTTHCWAGWIVHLAGEEGYALEEKTSAPFAAYQIYKASTGESMKQSNFYKENEEVMQLIKELGER